MATNFKQPGDIVQLVSPSGGTVTGVPELILGLFVVPLATVAVGLPVSCRVDGVWTLAKTSAQAWAEGEKIYWDDGNSRCDTDSTVGQLIGVAVAVAANPTATGLVRLNATTPDIAEGPQAAIVALTDSTGDSGTHNAVLADGLTATAPAAITAYVATVTNYAAATMTDPVTKAEGETFSTAMALLEDEVTAINAAALVIENEVTLLQVDVAACVTDLTVQNQNDSDNAQKIIQILAAMVDAGIIDA